MKAESPNKLEPADFGLLCPRVQMRSATLAVCFGGSQGTPENLKALGCGVTSCDLKKRCDAIADRQRQIKETNTDPLKGVLPKFAERRTVSMTASDVRYRNKTGRGRK